MCLRVSVRARRLSLGVLLEKPLHSMWVGGVGVGGLPAWKQHIVEMAGSCVARGGKCRGACSGLWVVLGALLKEIEGSKEPCRGLKRG